MKAALTLPQRPTALYMVAVLDILVLLLVIFVLVAGAGRESGVMVSLPESDFRLQRIDNPIVVTVKGGVVPAIFVGRERVGFEDFARHLEEVVEESGSESVLLRADASLSVGVERELIEIATKLGLQVALIGQEVGGAVPAPMEQPRPPGIPRD